MLWKILLIVCGAAVAALAALWLIGERGRLLRPSTRRLFREGGVRRILNLKSIHLYVYLRWIGPYVKTLLAGVRRAQPGTPGDWLANRYHAKVLTTDHAAAIVTLDRPIPLQDIEQIVPYPIARRIVLDGPPDVAAIECACRHARDNPCTPTDVCMVIGQPFVDFVVEHHPGRSRRLSRDEALDLLRAEHQRGHVHTAWFKDACLDRFYAICNCCPCCCVGIQAMVKTGFRTMSPSGYVARVDADLCQGCGACTTTCAFGAVTVNDSVAAIDWHRCMGCGACSATCAADAVSLVRDEKKGIPLDVRSLAAADPPAGAAPA